jgi:hypothetical protein
MDVPIMYHSIGPSKGGSFPICTNGSGEENILSNDNVLIRRESFGHDGWKYRMLNIEQIEQIKITLLYLVTPIGHI